MLSYPKSSSILQVHLPQPGPTIAPSYLYPESNPPLCIAHRWGGRPTFPLFLPAVSWCTHLWGAAPRLPLTPLPGSTNTLRLLHVSPSALWSVATPGGGNPPINWASTSSPPISCCLTRALTVPPPYTPLPGPAPLFLSFPSPLIPFPTAYEIYAGFGRPNPNCYYCRQSSALGM